MFSETTLDGACNKYCNSNYWGIFIWTAGQRIHPMNDTSKFVWRVTSADGQNDTVSNMTYTNWADGQPNNYRGGQSCMNLYYKGAPDPFTWNDVSCHPAYCSLCELDNFGYQIKNQNHKSTPAVQAYDKPR